MVDNPGQPPVDEAPPAGHRPAPKRTSWLRWVIPAAALAAGVLLGLLVGGDSDPTQSAEYRSLQGELSASREELDKTTNQRNSYRRSWESARDELQQREADLAAREADLDAREEAVTVTEEQIAAKSVGEGVWTVGIDIEPGTYRTDAPLLGECYWEITPAGSSDIIDNDIPTGGYPTVTLQDGQSFTNQGCGTFVKQ